MTDFIIAGTGTRNLQTASKEVKAQATQIVTNELTRFKEKHGDNLVVISGMAEGFDKCLALCAIRLDIRLWCAIPNEGYGAYYWGRKSLTGQNKTDEFVAIVSYAQRVVYVCDSLYVDSIHSNFIRNDWMIEHADEFIVWDTGSRGTQDALRKVKGAGLPYKVLND